MAADAGMSPVATESGRRKVATFRRACDKCLRDAMTTLADSSRLHNPWAKDIYLRARGRGCDHPHAYQSAFASLRSSPESRTFYNRKRREGKKHVQALIALARRRVNVLWAMLRDGTTFQSNPSAA